MSAWIKTHKKCDCGDPLLGQWDARLGMVWSGCKKCNRSWIGCDLMEDDPEVRRLFKLDAQEPEQLAFGF